MDFCPLVRLRDAQRAHFGAVIEKNRVASDGRGGFDIDPELEHRSSPDTQRRIGHKPQKPTGSDVCAKRCLSSDESQKSQSQRFVWFCFCFLCVYLSCFRSSQRRSGRYTMKSKKGAEGKAEQGGLFPRILIALGIRYVLYTYANTFPDATESGL